jgi:hypothetical protein
MDKPPSDSTGTVIQYIYVDGYPETSTFVSYTAVNGKRSLEIATDWSGIKKDGLLTETRVSWYQSIVKKHLWVYV